MHFKDSNAGLWDLGVKLSYSTDHARDLNLLSCCTYYMLHLGAIGCMASVYRTPVFPSCTQSGTGLVSFAIIAVPQRNYDNFLWHIQMYACMHTHMHVQTRYKHGVSSTILY